MQVETAEIINFNEIELEQQVRPISKEEERWLLSLPSTRLRLDTTAGPATELTEMQTTEKTLELYPYQLPLPALTTEQHATLQL